MNNKLVVILGQTASGKTDMSVKLAKKHNGEIVSADSRQVYKGLNIGSGKVTKKEMQRIPHHLLDVANPKRTFTVAQFQKLALRAIQKIQKEEKTPFLVGGTGFYIQSIVDGLVIPEVKPNQKLRQQLNKKTAVQLYNILKKLDPERAKSIDQHNPRRLVRAIEIVTQTKKPIPKLVKNTPFEVLQIGIKKSPQELKKSINKRLHSRLNPPTGGGMVNEVKKLHASGISWKRLEELGLEYRFVAQYLQGNITHQEMSTKLQKAIEHFAKRQMTWFKRDNRIHWVKNYQEAEKLVKKILQ